MITYTLLSFQNKLRGEEKLRRLESESLLTYMRDYARDFEFLKHIERRVPRVGLTRAPCSFSTDFRRLVIAAPGGVSGIGAYFRRAADA